MYVYVDIYMYMGPGEIIYCLVYSLTIGVARFGNR